MSLVQPNGIVGRTGLRSRKVLSLFVVLVLSGGALIFAAGEAHAKQQRPTQKVYAAATEPERTPVSERGLAESMFAEPATGPLPADSSPSQVDERDAGSSSSPVPDPATSDEPEPALALLEELEPASWPDLLSEAAMPESFGITPVPDPAYDPAVALLEPGTVPGPVYPVPFVDPLLMPDPTGFGLALPYPGAPEPAPVPAWGLVGSEAYKPPSRHVEEKSPVLPPTDTPSGVRPAPLQGNGVAKAVPAGPLPPVADRKVPPPGSALQEPVMPGSSPVTGPSREAALLLSSLEAAASSAVERLHGAAADISEALAPGDEAPVEPNSGGGAKEPSEDAPPPPSPEMLGGSYFSPSAGGQVGPGGIVPLLICVLAAGLILLRPVGRLSWASCQPPKPSLVLLGPRERPG